MRYKQRGLRGNSPNSWFSNNRVNLPDTIETIWEPLYDSVTYPAAGATSLTFFQEQIGKAGKTLKDTNMDLDGQLPKGKAFLVTGIQLAFYSGLDSDMAHDGDFPLDPNVTSDVRTFTENGHLIFRIQSKDYLRQAPLGKFPPVERLTVSSSLGGDNPAGDTKLTSIEYAAPCGREFSINGVLLESNQNFSIELRDLPALPSAQDGKIVCTLNGFIARNAQ